MPLEELIGNEFDTYSDAVDDTAKFQEVGKLSPRIIGTHVREKSKENYTKTEKQSDLEEPETDYPACNPPKRKKADIFQSEDLIQVEAHVRQTPPEATESYQALLDYLLKDLTSDIAKARAIFCWIVLQRVPLLLCRKDIPPPDSPVGYLHLIRQHQGTYSTMFATLCRKAQLPCVVINGIAKSVAYDVGDKLDPKKLKNSWNAVYLNGDWRLVHPHWAAMSAQGYNSGKWTIVDCPDFHDEAPKEASKSNHLTINDFYFLTDPEQFISKCLPNDEKWQLLANPISKTIFEESHFLQPTFYKLGLSIPKHNKCVVLSENGKAIIEVEMPDESHDRLRFSYKLYRVRDNADEGEYEYFYLDRFVFHYIKNTSAVFEIRFPPVAVGNYKLQVYCHDPSRIMISEWICDFRIICISGMEVCEPLPIVPNIGWGAGLELRNHNIVARTHKDGFYSIDDAVITSLKFEVDDETELYAELVHNDLSPSELNAAVSLEQSNNGVLVSVRPPTTGDYALRVYGKQKGAFHHKNVCNYLLRRSVVVENPTMAEIRSRLLQAIENGGTEILSFTIEEFIKAGLTDTGELKKAKRKLYLEKLKKEIKEALASRDLDKLDRAMTDLSDTSLKRDLGSIVEDADTMRTRLRKLKRLQKAVLDMDSKSISEIRSYHKPPSAVHGVMSATFLLLGNKETDLLKWSDVQGLISKKGKDSLKKRIAAFDSSKVSSASINSAKDFLRKYDKESVQIASAGAATFYLWTANMIHDAEDRS